MQPLRPSSVQRQPTRAHLLPKLRCQFAEFLLLSSLKRLRIFILPTCVRLRYGPMQLKLRGFSWELGISSFGFKRTLVPRLEVDPPDLPKGSLYTLHRDFQHPACLTFSVPSIALHGGSGILTRFPSATAFALTLGADSPCADERCAGNLGLSASGPFTRFIATHVSIRTSDTSSGALQPTFTGLRNALLPSRD